MAVVTGDRYLDLLARFVEANIGALLDGSMVLKLNPVGLHYVQTRLDQLQELEALRAGAPVDYLRAYIADLGDHRALERLRQVLRLLGSVKVVSMLPNPARDPSPITLLPFSRLKCLELRGCDLSTSSARGLLELRPILEKLICYNSADALKHIFAGRTAEVQGAQVWSRLSSISCSGNGMLLMDESLQLLPVVEALDLSRNRFAKVASLQKCLKLKYLDVGFNHITSVVNLHQILRCVTKLVLRNNALASVRGLERIATLEALDLSHNMIAKFREVELLEKLPCLNSLWLVGNPITFAHHYRKEALSYFRDPKKLVLDGRPTGMREMWAVRKIVISRQKLRSKYGAFTPAHTPDASAASLGGSDSGNVSDGSTTSANTPQGVRTRRRYSRLASIKDLSEHLVPSVCRAAEGSRQGSGDSDGGAQDGPEDREHTEEAVLDLMLQAEALRREGSSTWLKDLNRLLENESLSKKSQVLDAIAQKADDQTLQWQRRRRRKSMKKGLSASNSLSRDSASSDQFEDLHRAEGNLGTRSRGGSASSSRRTSRETFAEYFAAWDLDENYLGDADGELRSSFADGNRVHQLSPQGGELFVDNLAETFRLTEELISRKISARSSSSPPQFNQDLLHRRQELENELLLLPLEPEITPFHDSDSETSSDTTYSQLSDSSDGGHFSPSSYVRRPFSMFRGSRDCEEKGSETNGDTRDGGPSATSEGVASGDEHITGNKVENGNECTENKDGDMPAKQTVIPVPPRKVIPRRIIRLDSAEGYRRLGLSPRHPSIHRRSSSLGVGLNDVSELRRPSSLSVDYADFSGLASAPGEDVTSSKDAEGALPVPSINGLKEFAAAYTLQKVGSLDRSGSNPQLLRLHSMMGPVVDPCA